jgi:hypothetical protein
VRDYKNIDRIFQENLKNFEVFPPNKSWDVIEKQIAVQPVKKHIPFWVKLSSIAALFVLIFSVGTIYLLPESDFSKSFLTKTEVSSNTVSTDEKDSNQTNKATQISTISTTPNLNVETTTTSTQIDNASLVTEDTSLKKSANFSEANSKFFVAEATKNPFSYKADNHKIADKTNKFTVATIFAPIYINSLGDGSGIDSQFSNHTSSGNSSYSYGVKFAYEINNKFTVQSGVNLINLGFTTNNIYINSAVATIDFSSISATPLASRSVHTATKIDPDLVAKSNTGNLNQVFGYVEIPVELKYNVTDGKFGVNLVGGFSTLFLNRDEVFFESNDFSQSLGASNNLRSINFSGNIGVDIDYLIYKNLYINVSPMFKMQTNTFSKNSGSLQPYYLGVYTGLNYKF